MARYLRMLLNSGQRGSGRIVSAESFALLSTAYIKAPEFSPTASYGYGIAVDGLDGHKILRHTGGMTCFASSIHVDSRWRLCRVRLDQCHAGLPAYSRYAIRSAVTAR